MSVILKSLPLLALTIVCVPFGASAQLVVSEIMYDLQTGADTGREWIEVFNASEDALPITEWKVLEGGSNHSITAVQGGDSISSGGYGIIADNPAKFLVDYPGYAGLLFDSAFSGGLSNTGESITVGYMKDGSLVSTDSVAYQSAWGGAGDGTSLQRTTSESVLFSGGAPTPGTGALLLIPGLHMPAAVVEEPVVDQASTTDSDSHTPASPALGVVSSYVAPPEPLIYAYAGKDRDVIAGADVVYEGQAYDKKGAWLSASTTRFAWNFGDGNIGEGPEILHHFGVPGRYAVVLTVANATNAAAAKIAVNVHPVSISMHEQSGAVVLTNTSGFELDLSNWFFTSGSVLFKLPANTALLPNASAAFVASTTGITDAHDVALLYPNGTVAAQMGSSSPALAPSVITPQLPTTPVSAPLKKSTPLPKSELTPPVVESAEVVDQPMSSFTAQTAAAAAAVPTGYSHVWWIMAAALAIGSGAAASLISRSKKQAWDIEESE